MKIVFVSNYFNHHQAFLSDAFHKLPNIEYSFVEINSIPAFRKSLGYGIDVYPEYVVSSYKNEEEYRKAEKLITDADVVITAFVNSPLMKQRYKLKKLTFHYSERLFKTGMKPHLYFGRFYKYQKALAFKPFLHLLAASAYAYQDYRKLFLYRNKAYKWAYFPETKMYDIDVLMEKKQNNDKIEILWAGRFIDWKHPELVLETAAYLKAHKKPFHITMIGNGDLLEDMKALAKEKGVHECVTFAGSMKPTEVRLQMEKAAIYLFTSDQNEGWGAVLNEAMNSGCAVVADRRIGAAPFLIQDGENGIIYDKKEKLFQQTEALLDDSEARVHLGKAAYATIRDEWNAEVAATRFITIAEEIIQNGESRAFTEGPCSKIN